MKSTRQAKILQIVNNSEIVTQEELTQELSRAGITSTQATVSRDIKELGLIKKPAVGGKYVYAPPGASHQLADDRLQRLFAGSVLSIKASGNLVVVKTFSGSANTAAVVIDYLNLPDILGSVAGDDTILIVASSEGAVTSIITELQNLMA